MMETQPKHFQFNIYMFGWEFPPPPSFYIIDENARNMNPSKCVHT